MPVPLNRDKEKAGLEDPAFSHLEGKMVNCADTNMLRNPASPD
jgi:hypothetical protein